MVKKPVIIVVARIYITGSKNKTEALKVAKGFNAQSIPVIKVVAIIIPQSHVSIEAKKLK